jgi:hypothetical protein
VAGVSRRRGAHADAATDVGDDPPPTSTANNTRPVNRWGSTRPPRFDADTPEDELVELVASLGIDDSIDGIRSSSLFSAINPDVVVGAIIPPRTPTA